MLLDYLVVPLCVSAKASDRLTGLKIAFVSSTLYLIIFVGLGSTTPNFDPLALGPLTAELMFGGFFFVASFLVYIFASKKTTWKMMKSASIGRYGRLFYLVITAIILLTYGLILTGFLIGYLGAEDEKEKQNLLTGLILTGVLFGYVIFLYLRHVYKANRGSPSRFARHPPLFRSFQDKIPK